MNFKVKEIEDKSSLGYFLKSQRRQQGYTLADISRKILVAERYLYNLEEEDFQNLPGEIYFKNFLKRYVEFLGFSFEEVYSLYEKVYDWSNLWKKNKMQPRLPLSSVDFVTWPKVLRATLVSLVAIAIFAYLGFTAYYFMKPPSLTVIEPQDKIVIQDNHILVRGKTDPNAVVTINQEEVILENGSFVKDLYLQPGPNEIVIKAAKKHGRFAQINRQVIVAEKGGIISKH